MVDNTIALQVKPLDIATPLMQAAKMRQMETEQQIQKQASDREETAAAMRGLAPYADSPEFGARWTQTVDDLAQRGVMRSDIAANMRNNPSVLSMRSVLAQSEKPELQFQKQQLAETTRQHQATIGMEEKKLAETTRQHQATIGVEENKLAELKRQHDIAEGKPVTLPAGASLVTPKGETVVKGNDGLSDASNEITARQIINGDLSGLQNIGRGAQGDAKLTSIKNKAAELLITEYGMSPKEAAGHLSAKLQEYKAGTAASTAAARTTATREENLNNILKVTAAAIPAAIEASERVQRTGWVPINRIIQKGQVMASNPELAEFGMANLQLAEHWARAMNPNGIMRESDRDKALEFLSTATSTATYKRIVMQLEKQITRERDAIKSNPSHKTPDSPIPGVEPPKSDPFGVFGPPTGK